MEKVLVKDSRNKSSGKTGDLTYIIYQDLRKVRCFGAQEVQEDHQQPFSLAYVGTSNQDSQCRSGNNGTVSMVVNQKQLAVRFPFWNSAVHSMSKTDDIHEQEGKKRVELVYVSNPTAADQIRSKSIQTGRLASLRYLRRNTLGVLVDAWNRAIKVLFTTTRIYFTRQMSRVAQQTRTALMSDTRVIFTQPGIC